MKRNESPAGGRESKETLSAEITPDRVQRQEPWNLVVLTLHQVVLRSGWIFKTETVIVPAFLDAIAGAAWLRGCLPILNRFGQSVPPLLFASRLASMRYKKWALAGSTLLMGLPLLLLAGVWYAVEGQPRAWMPLLFLTIYTVFGGCNGVNLLAFGTVQGKLIQPARRGRLLAVSSFFGAVAAIALAWWLLGAWLELPGYGFQYIFGFSGACFLLAGLVAMAILEPSDGAGNGETSGLVGSFRDAWRLLHEDAAFRRLALVAVFFATILILFPHFQAFARIKLGLVGSNLMVWVLVQNAMLGLYSLLVGPLADRRGNRFTLRTIIFCLAFAPLVAVGLTFINGNLGERLYWIVFALLGLTPITMKSLNNYTLELSPTSDHPRYLSTLAVCLAVPFGFSPLVGWLNDLFDFEPIFLAGSALLVLAGLLTFRLPEPRFNDENAAANPLPE